MPRPVESPGLFDELVLLQKATDEIVVWSNLTMQLVKIAYPMSNGRRIEPEGVRHWLERRGLFWLCFCAAAAPVGEIKSCRIVHAIEDRAVYAFCAEYPSKCNFFVNITNAHVHARLQSEYFTLPTIKSTFTPDMKGLKHQFENRVGIPGDRIPYFAGYCGDYEGIYRGVRQRCGAFPAITGASFNTQRNGAFGTQQSISDPGIRHGAGPSRLRPEAHAALEDKGATTKREYDLLVALSRGEGIDGFQKDFMLEVCDRCNKAFMASALIPHIRVCDA